MGRNKTFDPEEKLARARSLFNAKGYSATSIADLVEDLGINPKSLYAEFGSKQELFEASLRLHNETAVTAFLGPLEAGDTGVGAIRALLSMWRDGARASGFAGVGCLLCNTASERAANDPLARKHVRAYIRRIRAAFRNALENARANGDLSPSADLDATAAYLTSHAIGQLTLIRSNAAPEVVESAATVALAYVSSLED